MKSLGQKRKIDLEILFPEEKYVLIKEQKCQYVGVLHVSKRLVPNKPHEQMACS